MMNLRPIIDSWNMIEKYKIQTAGATELLASWFQILNSNGSLLLS